MNKGMIFLMAVVFLMLGGCEKTTDKPPSVSDHPSATEEEEKLTVEGKNLLKDLFGEDIVEVKMTGEPKIDMVFSESQMSEFLDIVDTIVIYEQVPEEETITGQMFHYQITKRNGDVLLLEAITPYFIIDGVWYKTKYEPCEELNQFSNRIVDEE